MSVTLDPRQWAQEQFGGCQLGDARRTKRAVEVAARVAALPSGSTPQQTHGWGECKAAYRLFHADDVTFETLGECHWRQTRERAVGHCLALGDTTELDFGIHRQVEGLGPTGDGGGYGFFLHSSLLVRADSEEIFGLAAQQLFYRQPAPQGESRYDRTQRERESRVWGEVIDQVGPAVAGARITHIFDRGADNFEVFCKLLLNQTDWVIRAAQLRRGIVTPAGESKPLQDYLESLPMAGSYTLRVRSQKNQKARNARLQVRFGRVIVPEPQHLSPWLKECRIAAIVMWVVEVREVGAPKGVQPLRWVLYTSHPVETFNDAWRVVEYYEKRPLIEEYHKALKTGCRVEERQYQTSARLEAVAGMLAVAAVRLLQLRSAARTQPHRPATEFVPRVWLEVLQQIRGSHQTKNVAKWTVRDFYRRMAGLGGFLGRKRDGEPGWITLWRGFEHLSLLVNYEQNEKAKCG